MDNSYIIVAARMCRAPSVHRRFFLSRRSSAATYLAALGVLNAHTAVNKAALMHSRLIRVVFKLAIIVFQSLRGETPSYLADDCQLIADSERRCLRSADANALTVPRTNTRFGDRSFSVAGPKVWNSLPATLRQPEVELGQFKRLLKTFLFGQAAAH